MIGVLLALHPRPWRERYGEELRALLESGPLTGAVVADVLRNAGRQRLAARPLLARIAAALATSVVVEVAAVRAALTDNILWAPSTPLRGVALAALLLPWVAVADFLSSTSRRCPLRPWRS